MPDGYDLARQLEKLNEDLRIPIVVVSGIRRVSSKRSPAPIPTMLRCWMPSFNPSTLGIAVGLSSEPSEPSGNLYPIINDTFLRITGRSRRELVELGWEQCSIPRMQLRTGCSAACWKRVSSPDTAWRSASCGRMDPRFGWNSPRPL